MQNKLTRLIGNLAISCVSSIAVFCHTSQVDAQLITMPEVEVIRPNAIQGLRICNHIMNLASANPGNIQLRMQARSCSLRLYKYQLCLVRESAAFPPNPNLAAKCANENLGG